MGKIIVSPKDKKVILGSLRIIVLVLSVLLIVFISYDSFKNIPFLQNKAYMTFQLWTCIVFILAFFIEMYLSDNRKHFFWHGLIFLLLSIPYLNIINAFDIRLNSNTLYLVRFIPLARGALALTIVLGYISHNKISSIFVSYLSILVLITYFAGLIFYQREHPLNPMVTSYWDAFWWGCMQVTTLGCDIYPVTAIGKILCVVLSLMGMIMFPLFTVYLSNLIISKSKKKVKAAS